MQVSIETTSELSRKMTVQIPEEKIQEQVDKRLKSMAGKIKLDGFRPGKAPQSVIQKRYGKGVREEVVAELTESSFFEAVREEKIKPVAAPYITREAMAEGEGLKYVADFEVLPEFVLFPLEHMEVNRYVSEVTDEDLDAMLLSLREQRRTWSVTENPAVSGNRVIVDLEGQAEGENFTDGKMKHFTILLGSGQFIPGFEDQVEGCVAGSSKTFSLEFPPDYNNEKLAGKLAEFTIDVESVEESVLPALDDEFLKAFGIEDGDVEMFRMEIKANMEREMQRGLNAKSKNSVMDSLLRKNDSLTLPSILVDHELKALLNNVKDEAGKRKQSLDESVAKAHLAPTARRRVALGLLLNRIIETKQVALDAARVRRTVEDLALSYEQPDEVVGWYYSNREQLTQVQNMVMEDQVVDLILEQAKVTDVRVSFKELMQPATPITIEG